VEAKVADAASRAAQAAAKKVQDRIYRARRTLDDVRALRESEAANALSPRQFPRARREGHIRHGVLRGNSCFDWRDGSSEERLS
jgi:hypothetical protein